MIEKSRVLIDNLNIAYTRSGSGNPIVVLHGWGANIESIVPILNSIPSNFEKFAYDAPGFGDSEEPKVALSTHDYADYLLKFLQEMNIEKATFIGHSFGGKTLTIFAAEHPEMVEKLILVDASGVIAKRGPAYYFKVYSFKLLKNIYRILNFSKDREAAMKKFYEKFGSDDYQASQGVMRETLVKVVNESTVPYFKEIQAETLLIWGENDDATPLYMAEVFEKNIKNSGLVVLKGGHYSYIDDYGTFDAVIKSFFK